MQKFEKTYRMDAPTLDVLLRDHVKIAMEITKKIKVAPLFESYLEHGYYPFYRDADSDFYVHLRETFAEVVDDDLPAVENVSYETEVGYGNRIPLWI